MKMNLKKILLPAVGIVIFVAAAILAGWHIISSRQGEDKGAVTSGFETSYSGTETYPGTETHPDTEDSTTHQTETDSAQQTTEPDAPETDIIGPPTPPDPDENDGSLKIKSFKLLMKDNANLTEDITYKISGNTITGTVKCVLDPALLRSARLSVVTNKGEYSFSSDCLNSDGTVNLLYKDGCSITVYEGEGKTGKSVTYKIVTNYVPTKLPVVIINVDSNKEVASKTEYENARVRINSEHVPGFSSVAETKIKIRGRGNSTWSWEKKPYQIKFETKTPVLGMTAAKRWVLLANYIDKSLIRNNVAMALSDCLGFDFTAEMQPVDVFLNGDYIGVYTIGEKVEVTSGRVKIKTGKGVDCGFLIEMGGKKEDDRVDYDYFHLNMLKFLAIEFPDEDERNPDRTYYIHKYMQSVEDAIVSGGDYEKLIDVDSVVDWLILTELTYNLDACFRRSCFFTKDAGGKLVMGPVWDFDTAFGNMWADHGNYNAWASLSQDKGYIKDNWIVYLMKDPDFRERLRTRWNEVKDKLLSAADSTINELSEKIEGSSEYNFKRWDILNRVVGCEPSIVKKYPTYELQVKYLRDFIIKRWNFIENNISEEKLLSMLENRDKIMAEKAEKEAKEAKEKAEKEAAEKKTGQNKTEQKKTGASKTKKKGNGAE